MSGARVPVGQAAKRTIHAEELLTAEDLLVLSRRDTRSLVADARWALDSCVAYRALKGKYERAGDDSCYEGLRGLFLTAPSTRAILSVVELAKNYKEESAKLRGILQKVDAEEAVKRENDSLRRFDVIGKLADVGRPVPPWLTQAGGLVG